MKLSRLWCYKLKLVCIVFVRRLVEEVKEKCGISVETEEVYMNTG